MTTLQQAEALRQQAIEILVSERNAIDQKLQQLGYNDTQETARTIPNGTHKKSCTRCGEPGHNARRCPKPNAHASLLDVTPQGTI
jgi:hypothetical protein